MPEASSRRPRGPAVGLNTARMRYGQNFKRRIAYMHVQTSTYIYIHIYIDMCMSSYIHMYVCMYVDVQIYDIDKPCIYTHYTYLCVYVCIYTYIYIYIYAYLLMATRLSRSSCEHGPSEIYLSLWPPVPSTIQAGAGQNCWMTQEGQRRPSLRWPFRTTSVEVADTVDGPNLALLLHVSLQ